MPHLFWAAFFPWKWKRKTFLVLCYRQCISANCFEFQKMVYQKKKKTLLLKTFSFPLITCMREYLLFCFAFSHCSNKSLHALYFSHTDLFALPSNTSGLYFGCRFLLDFYMPEPLIFSGLHNAGRSYSRCSLRSANHSTGSRSDLNAQAGKQWHEVQPERVAVVIPWSVRALPCPLTSVSCQ